MSAYVSMQLYTSSPLSKQVFRIFPAYFCLNRYRTFRTLEEELYVESL